MLDLKGASLSADFNDVNPFTSCGPGQAESSRRPHTSFVGSWCAESQQISGPPEGCTPKRVFLGGAEEISEGPRASPGSLTTHCSDPLEPRADVFALEARCQTLVRKPFAATRPSDAASSCFREGNSAMKKNNHQDGW